MRKAFSANPVKNGRNKNKLALEPGQKATR
jgi:hypothetical protein